MTCRHVIDLIDAGPFAGCPRAHLEAAWQHARECPACGPALRTAEALIGDLRTLPQLTPSRDVSAGVLARVAALETAAATEALPVSAPAAPRPAARPVDWGTAVGAVASTAAVALAVAGEVSIPGSSSSRDGTMNWLIQAPAMTAGTVLLAGCLVLYSIGLLAAATDRKRELI